MPRRMLRSRRPMRKRKYAPKKRYARKSRVSTVHVFKRQAPGLELTNSSVVGIAVAQVAGVPAEGAKQISLQTPIPENSTTGGGNHYRFGAVGNFNLANVLESSDLTNLYDRYKINGIRIKIIPCSNISATNGAGLLPTLLYHTDYDDGVVPTTDTMVRVKSGSREVRLDKPRTIYFKPKVASTILGASAGIAYSVPRAAPYINMTYPDAPHFGLKMYFRDVNLSATGAGVNTLFRFETTYYISCKDPQ